MGSGYRTFAVSEVLTAANVMNYLMEQAVMSFADSTARDAAVTSPEEGMVAYLQDTNTITVYTGAAWVLLDTLVDHGTLAGLADDDHTQYVLRSILTTRGDLFRRGASAIERVALGASGTVLTSDGTDAVWAASASGASILDSDSATSGGASSVAEFTVATLTIPQNDPAAGDIYRFGMAGTFRTAAGNLTIRTKLGTTTVLNDAFNVTSTLTFGWLLEGFVKFTSTTAEFLSAKLTRPTEATSVSWPMLDSTAAAGNEILGFYGTGTAAEDSTAGAVNLTFTGQFSSSDVNNNVSLSHAYMEKVTA